MLFYKIFACKDKNFPLLWHCKTLELQKTRMKTSKQTISRHDWTGKACAKYKSAKHFQQGSHHHGLDKLTIVEHLFHLIFRDKHDTDILRGIEVLRAMQCDTFCEVTIAMVVLRACVGSQRHQERPRSSGIACLFHQFALRSRQRCLARLHTACHNLGRDLPEAVSILPFKHNCAFVGDGNNVDPIGIMQHIIIIIDTAIRQLHLVAACIEPQRIEKRFGLQHFPFHIVILSHK